jgi:hypothetical protein
MRADAVVLRHEDVADAVLAHLRQGEAKRFGLRLEEFVGNLHQDARTVADQGVRADRAPVGQVLEDLNSVLDDLMRPPPFQVGDEADTAGIVIEARVIEAGQFVDRLRSSGTRDTVGGASGLRRKLLPALAYRDGRSHGSPHRSRAPVPPASSGGTFTAAPFGSADGRYASQHSCSDGGYSAALQPACHTALAVAGAAGRVCARLQKDSMLSLLETAKLRGKQQPCQRSAQIKKRACRGRLAADRPGF